MKDDVRVSAKMAKFKPSLTLALKRLAEDREAADLPVYDFGLGETKGALNRHIRDAGVDAFHGEHTMYTDPAGMPELRQAALSWLGLERHYTVDNVVITAGAKQSLFNLFLAVCNPGDVVLFDAAPGHAEVDVVEAVRARIEQALTDGTIQRPEGCASTSPVLTRHRSEANSASRYWCRWPSRSSSSSSPSSSAE